MSIAYFVKQIQPEEKIKKVIYKSIWVFLPKISLAILLIWASLFFYFWLEQSFSSIANWLTGLGVVLGTFFLIRIFMKLKYTAWVITNHRLLDFDQRNFWQNDMSEVDVNEIFNPTFIKKGFWASLGGCWTLRVFMEKEKAFLELDGILKSKKLISFLTKNINTDKEMED